MSGPISLATRITLCVTLVAACAGIVLVWNADSPSDKGATAHQESKSAPVGKRTEEPAPGSSQQSTQEGRTSSQSAAPLAKNGKSGENSALSSNALTAEDAVQGKEIQSADPLVKKYVNDRGEVIREIRNNALGLPVKDTRFVSGQEMTVEKTYRDDGELVLVRRYQNGRLVDTQEIR